MLGLSELVGRISEDSDVRRMAGDIAAIALRSSELTHKFLVFSRQDVRRVESIDVANCVRDTAKLLRASIPEDRVLDVVLGEDLGIVNLPSVDLEQAIINICNNASAAMPSGGSLRIDVRILAEETGRHVHIAIADTGTGMTERQLLKACDVFYTTKPSGEGTGLGLAMVKRTMEEAGGRLMLESVLGRGTTVTIVLPCGTEVVTEPDCEEPIVVTGEETVLVVEDNAMVRRVTASHLSRAGFDVLQASDGLQALELIRSTDNDVAVVVTDVIMPNLGGVALLDALSAEPSIPGFLFTTGYDAGALDAELLAGPKVDFLRKPYAATAMLARVRNLIDSAAESEGD